MIKRLSLAFALFVVTTSATHAQGVPTRMSDAEMWRFLVGGYDGNHRYLKPVDPGFNWTGYLTEDDPLFWFRTDAGVDAQGNDYADTQRMDAQLVQRGGKWVGMRAFDYGQPSNNGKGFFNYDPVSDGGDLYTITNVLLADGTRARGAAIFYTRDGGSAAPGLWVTAQDCVTPGAVLFLDDIDYTERTIKLRGPNPQQLGGDVLNPNCPGDAGGIETTTYRRATLQVPYWIDGALQPPKLFDAFISMHWNMGPDAILGPSDYFIGIRDIGVAIWREYDRAGPDAWARNAALLAQSRLPLIGGLSDPQGVVVVDNRHGMRFWTVPNGKLKGKDFAWPPAGLMPPS